MKITRLYLIISLLAVFPNCNYESPKYPEFKKVLLELNASSDSIKIPKKLNGQYLQIYYRVKDWSTQLAIKPLDTGFNSFQFRMWMDIPGLALRQRLLIVNYNSTTDDFSAEAIRFEDSTVSAPQLLRFVIRAKSQIKTPKSGWSSFTKDLFSEDILLIFDENNGYIDQAYLDSDSYCFEIITKRHYWFSNFGALYEDDKNKRILGLIKKVFLLIENEFDFHRI